MRSYPARQPQAPVPNATSWNGQRDRAAQARFRRNLIRQAGGLYCQRCGKRGVPIEAHHTGPDTGLLLCAGPNGCHKGVDPNAR